MKKGAKIALLTGVVIAVAAVTMFAFRGRIFSAAPEANGKEQAYAVVNTARGDISVTVSASGKLEPKTYTTIRPDPNMPARKLVRILVSEGQGVKAGQALAEIDRSGLDLDLQSAQAGYQAQKVTLANLRAMPTAEQLAQSLADLEQARQEMQSARENFDSMKSLAEKNLASKNQLADAERGLVVAEARLNAAQQAFDSVKAGSGEDVIQAQEAAVAQAESALQKALLILDSTVIRSPSTGVVTNIVVQVGDLVTPSSALMSVADMTRMVLRAQVNEYDVGQVRIGQATLVTPSAFPDLQLMGTVTQLDLTAQVVGNVSVFDAAIEVPNREMQLLWGMNADAEIQVLHRSNVLTLPNTAIQRSGGSSRVMILQDGKPVFRNVQIGATDGLRTEIVAGLDEGQEVAVLNRKSAGQGQNGQNPQGPGAMFRFLH
jgi:HlyD family secretion protein